MLRGMIGRKVGMTQIFSENGERIPVTAVEMNPGVVVQLKTNDTDGYEGVQVGFEPATKEKHTNKPLQGHFKDVPPQRILREFATDDISAHSVGEAVTLDMFTEGEKVDVSGTSKGRGFQGVIKRHNFKGGPGAHGSRFHRQPGSIGNRTFPGRVFPGKRMPGHMGAKRVTIRNLDIVKVIPEQNLLLIKGAIPSHNGAVVEIRKADWKQG